MTLEIVRLEKINKIMESYISKVRPAPDIRHQLDLSYEIKGQSVILNEVRPIWNNPKEIRSYGYAKTTYVKSKNIWKVYWMRADLKWHPYYPKPIVKSLNEFLRLVDKDEYGCFMG